MIRVIDISRYQVQMDFAKAKRAGVKAVIAKATQGYAYVDPMYATFRAQVREAGLQFGSYHFATGADASKEADHFCDVAGKDMQFGDLLALDYEIYTLKNPAAWCRIFLDRVAARVGFKPLLYTYHKILLAYDWSAVSKGDYGLWAARYGLQQAEPNQKYAPALGSWKFYALWQFTSEGSGMLYGAKSTFVDLNTATDQLLSYGRPPSEPPVLPPLPPPIVSEEVQFYSQHVEAYKDIRLGQCTTTLFASSCFITSFCNLFRILGRKLDGKGGFLNPEELNDLCTAKGCYTGGCSLNAPKLAQVLGFAYERETIEPASGIVIAETDHYKKVGTRQHFFLYNCDSGLRLDPLDENPKWEANDYNLVSFRICTFPPAILAPEAQPVLPTPAQGNAITNFLKSIFGAFFK